MTYFFIAFTGLAVLLRIGSVLVSRRNERALKSQGATEYGAINSHVLTALHIIFYAAVLAEGWLRGPRLDGVAATGVVLYAIGMATLLFVIRILGRFWTVKLIIANDHQLVTHPLLRILRHPNYLLNIIPELIGLALVFHSFGTLAIGMPLYLVSLVWRIRQEERVMRERFPELRY